MAGMKTRRAGQPSFGGRLARMSNTHRTIIAFTTMLIAALLLLANRAQPRYHSGEVRSGNSHNFPRKQLASGNAMKFLDSQHNLQHSNLSDTPVEDSNKIFKGRPSLGSSDAGQDGVNQGQKAQGFLANVNPLDLQASSIINTTPPAGDTNPLGFYFNKQDVSAAVGKTGGGQGLSLEKPVGQNKAALGYYFNKEKPQSVNLQQASKGSIKQSPEREATVEERPARHGKGLSSITQTSVYLHQKDHSASHKGKAVVATVHSVQERGAAGSASTDLLAGNLTKVDFKPLTISLNTDDV